MSLDITLHDVDADIFHAYEQKAKEAGTTLEAQMLFGLKKGLSVLPSEIDMLDHNLVADRALFIASLEKLPLNEKVIQMQAYFKQKYGVFEDSTPFMREDWDA